MKMNNQWFEEEPQQKFINLECKEIEVDTPSFRPLTPQEVWELIDLEHEKISKNDHHRQGQTTEQKVSTNEDSNIEQVEPLEMSFHLEGLQQEDQQMRQSKKMVKPEGQILKQEAKLESVPTVKVAHIQQIEEADSVDGEEIFFYSRRLDNTGSSLKIPNPTDQDIKQEKAQSKAEEKVKVDREQSMNPDESLRGEFFLEDSFSIETTLNLSSFENLTISDRGKSNLNWYIKTIGKKRPKRYRTKPIKFWIGEKIKYVRNVAVEQIRKKEMKDYFSTDSQSVQGWKTIINTYTIFQGSFDLKSSHNIDLNFLGLNGDTVILSIEHGKSLSWVASCLIVEDKRKGVQKIRIQQERILKVRNLCGSRSTIGLKILAATQGS